MDTKKFDDHFALAQLPYFEIEDGRLKFDPAMGPVIDMHTHLALQFLAPPSIDMEQLTDEVENYLPTRGLPIDMEIYGNLSFDKPSLERMNYDLIWGCLRKPGARLTHTAANLLRAMKDLQISHCVMHAIELPLISHNSEIYLEVSKRHPGLITFGSAHPYAPGAAKRIDKLAKMGVKGIKVHPSTQGFYPQGKRMMKLYERCAANNLPVLYHCGPAGIEPEKLRRFTQVKLYEQPIAEFPTVTFYLGHSGATQTDEAIDLALRYPNVVLDVSCQGAIGMRKIFERADHERIVFGTDWPFYHQAFGLAKTVIACEGDDQLRRKVMYENAARLLGLDNN
ncbi:MAG: amidohydrolase family protein [Candidatus Alcyoniella australis]|nr:amidohydrolase family protein [Candidatus Alcyoniella australis]